jgi:aquaporin Z
VRGQERRDAAAQPALGGIHVVEWTAEAAGTALLIIGGLSAFCLDFGRGSPVARLIPSPSARLLLTGLLFAGTGSLIAISPLGRRSGGHLNPAVTLAFRITGHVHSHDVVGYVLAQCTGALAGAAVVRLVWRDVAASVGLGVTHPGPHVTAVAAVGIEALMTALLVGTILLFVSHRWLMAWTPLAVWIVAALLVWMGARFTGPSLNPARSLGPALAAATFGDLWVYTVGPPLGAIAVALALRLVPGWQPLTAKLCPDPRYPSTLASAVPVAEHPSMVRRS